ncbi:MAG: hypothetical protein GY871_04205 [Actinomycetales bacterium]|nr:hypothetical protein [Actinomycetales bacterium]
MPTGYTYKVANGECVEFEDFALQCARGMGLFMHMRDDPADFPLRYPPEPKYQREALARAVKERQALESMPLEERIQYLRDARTRSAAEKRSWREDDAAENARYEAMQAKVDAWEPADGNDFFSGLKQFMGEQLALSRQAGTTPSQPKEVGAAEAEEWLAMLVGSEERSRERLDEAEARHLEFIRLIDLFCDEMGVERPK